MFKFKILLAFLTLIKLSIANSKSQELARNFLISSQDMYYSIIYLFILFSFESSKRGERYHRYWRGTRESSDSFRRVRNNLLNYRMPKVTSTRREDDARESGNRRGREREDRRKGNSGCNGTDREDGRFATIGILHGISRVCVRIL